MAKVLIDIPIAWRKCKISFVKDCIKSGIVLDGLTNGEVFMKMYSISQDDITYVDALVPYALIKSDKLWSVEPMVIPLDWWNSKWGE